jgi:chromosome segregation ATPase
MSTNSPDERTSTEETWREVGRQFQVLGQSLAAAFRASLESEEGRRHLKNVESGLKAMIAEVQAAIDEAAASPPAQTVRIRAEKAATTARFASEEALQEARPQILSALRQVNAELQRLIARLDERPPADRAK